VFGHRLGTSPGMILLQMVMQQREPSALKRRTSECITKRLSLLMGIIHLDDVNDVFSLTS